MLGTRTQVWVVQKGFTDIAHGFSVVPSDIEQPLEEIPGVRSANPITGARSEVPTPKGGRSRSRSLATTPERASGVRVDFDGEPAVPAAGEVVIDETFADTAGLDVGDQLELPDHPREIVALSSGTNQFQNQLAFGALDDVRGLLRLSSNDVNFFALQVEEDQVDGVRAAIQDQFPFVTAFAKPTFVENNAAEIRDSFEPIVRVMVGIAFFVGTAIVGLTMFTATTEKSREYGVLSAIGADRRALTGVIMRQAAIAAALGFVLGCLLSVPAGWVVLELAPNAELEYPAWLLG
jgi:putative ABC transport system permease protein